MSTPTDRERLAAARAYAEATRFSSDESGYAGGLIADLLERSDFLEERVRVLTEALAAIVAEGWALEATGGTGRTLIEAARAALAGTGAPPVDAT